MTADYRTAAAVECAAVLSNYVNRNGSSILLATEMANDHPTLQQGMMRLVREFIRQMAEKSYVDARNEGSSDMARRIVADWETNGEPNLPFI